MATAFLVVYLLATAIIGLTLVWWVRRILLRTEEQRKQHLEELTHFDAVKTSSPHDNPISRARTRALENVGTRYGIIRHLLIPLILILVAVAWTYPFLGHIPANLVSLMVAAATVVVGIAAKPLVENLIAGIVISFSQPIRIGDTILIEGNYGTVEDITMVHTRIKIWDWRRYIVPNSLMLQKEFINYTIVDTYQWAYIEFWVGYDADLEWVQETSLRATSESRHFADYEPPKFWIMEMDKNGVKCWVAA
jgi:small-conductance mechanosensitive channel